MFIPSGTATSKAMSAMLIDSHCHVGLHWYEPVETLLHHMACAGIAQAVLVQMLGQTDSRYQQDCLRRFPGRFSSVVIVDPTQPQAIAELHALADDGAAGVRLRPTARSPGSDPLAIWRCAEERDLAISCVGNGGAFSSPEFASLIAALPKLVIVLEHLGGTNQPDADDQAHAQRLQVLEQARFPNVYMKIPGLGELTRRILPPPAGGHPFDSTTPSILLKAIAGFGPHRLMWGSDFPVVSSREGYGNSLSFVRTALEYLPRADLDEIFGMVAQRVFKLPATAIAAKGPSTH